MLKAFESGMFQIVFMDIIMKEINGVETAKILRDNDSELLIVFTTTSREYAFDAFPVDPFDYVLKPYSKKYVSIVLDDALQFFTANDPKITIKVGCYEYTITFSHTVEIRLTDGKCISGTMTFRDTERFFAGDARFLLCNREHVGDFSAGGRSLYHSHIMIVDASTGRKLFCFFNSVMLCGFCPLYTVFIMASLEAENEIWHTAGLCTLQLSIVNAALVLVIWAIFFKTLHVKLSILTRQKYIGAVWDFLFLVSLFMTVLMLRSIPVHPDLAVVGRLRPAVLILMMILLLYHVFWWTAAKLTDGAKIQQENTLLTMEGKRYEELRGYMDETRTIRQHILVITQLSGFGKFGELQNDLEQFREGTETNYTGYCDNFAIDAVDSHYTAAAGSQSAKIDWRMTLPHDLPMKESDYCVVLGNLLENALRVVKHLSSERRNTTIISYLLSETIIGLSVDNPYSGKITFRRNGLPRSDREGHGIGLTSVMNTVSRYDGSMNIKSEKNIFSVDIVFHCSAK